MDGRTNAHLLQQQQAFKRTLQRQADAVRHTVPAPIRPQPVLAPAPTPTLSPPPPQPSPSSSSSSLAAGRPLNSYVHAIIMFLKVRGGAWR